MTFEAHSHYVMMVAFNPKVRLAAMPQCSLCQVACFNVGLTHYASAGRQHVCERVARPHHQGLGPF